MEQIQRKLDELEIAASVCAPRNKGTCDVLIGCFSCNQTDTSKISVHNEYQEKIKHSLGPEDGEDGTVYELECDICHFQSKLGVVIRERHGVEGDYNFHSLFGSDETTGNKWMWLGFF
jgi:hypothetical protein